MRFLGLDTRLLATAGLAVAALLLVAGPAPAADPAHGSDDKLGFLGLKRYDLGIYTLIVFGILLFILSKFAWPHISEGLQKREAAIIGAREEAQKLLREADDLRAKLKADLSKAQEDVRAMYDQARKDADRLKAEEREAVAQEVAARKAAAEREIGAAKEAAMQEIYQQAVELATMLSAKTLRRQISPEDHRRLLDEALAELKGGPGRA